MQVSDGAAVPTKQQEREAAETPPGMVPEQQTVQHLRKETVDYL